MKTGHAWTQSGLHLGNRRKSPRDLDNHGLPAGCESLVRRGERRIASAKIEGVN